MKTNIIISFFAAMVLVGCGEDTLSLNTNDEINSLVEVEERIDVETHYQGESCLNCHTSSGSLSSLYLSDSYDDDSYDDDENENENENDDYSEYEDNDNDTVSTESTENDENEENENDEGEELDSDDMFTSGATVYTTIDGTSSSTYATGYKIRLILENTDEVVSYYNAKGDGNSYTGYTNSINNYTAQVVNSNNEVVNSSFANSHGVDRLDCNRCHTSTGAEGAPGRITSYDYYVTDIVDSTDVNTTVVDTNTSTQTIAATVSFATDVMSSLTSKCIACHGNNGNFTVTDSASTYTNITANRFVNTTSVDTSALLVKSSGGNGHLNILTTNSTEYLSIKDWITQGALNN